MVSLRPITESNRATVEALRVAPGQEQFVSSVAESLIEAAEEPEGRALYWAVYADETPVGFVMISDEVGPGDYIPHYLWKLFIDGRYQRQGFGTATLDLIVEYFRGRPGVEVLSTSAGQGDGSPIAFCERYGFEQTGEIVFDDEVLLGSRSISAPEAQRERTGPAETCLAHTLEACPSSPRSRPSVTTSLPHSRERRSYARRSRTRG